MQVQPLLKIFIYNFILFYLDKIIKKITFRIRLPLFISAGFVLCHIFSVYLPTVEINVEVVEENRREGTESSDDEEDEAEFSLGSEDSEEDSDLDLALFVEIVGERAGQ